MQRLIEGVQRFRTEEFGNFRKLFRKLSQEGQNPHTLFLTCSDSRVLAELITHSQPSDAPVPTAGQAITRHLGWRRKRRWNPV